MVQYENLGQPAKVAAKTMQYENLNPNNAPGPVPNYQSKNVTGVSKTNQYENIDVLKNALNVGDANAILQDAPGADSLATDKGVDSMVSENLYRENNNEQGEEPPEEEPVESPQPKGSSKPMVPSRPKATPKGTPMKVIKKTPAKMVQAVPKKEQTVEKQPSKKLGWILLSIFAVFFVAAVIGAIVFGVLHSKSVKALHK